MQCHDSLVSLTFCSRTSRLKLLRCVVRDAADMVGLDEQATDAVVLAVNEACMNIIEHAYCGAGSGKILIIIEKNNEKWRFELIDFAPAVDIKSIKAKDLAEVRPGGLGVNFIKQIMDSAVYENINEEQQQGNRLILTKTI